ncbi:anaphase-promoting complex, cyclosome, subunit 4-domain-containing protein [Dichomitus squalens]|uniref:Anaphase-promoting complex subunit 4 n=1 Tax=Dichomitus squalens TaxID=114155 RepID=A0A4Q9P645_9APHY|nr:anaphase-promoting complex, cyclosome, subunit 4-domain-containing protein [Dichomitus squalens]TBU48352.1 anaphase-promoting complex, cyclosome, subunit 4-domain-containing protein [Dichomitus squalens]TBU65056.1 anaphase-promoting complex, cyclosome, subunit 4-domain-containing protein [Dichomitus squalens]
MATTIAPVATIQLPAASRVLRTSWCPDKDLLVVTTHVSHQEKMTLYKMQGSKKWEVTIQPQLLGKTEAEVVGVAWSPDVQSIAVASNPPMVSIHSIQDGKEIRSYPIELPYHKILVTGVWWFLEEKKVVGNGLPDIFKRGENITGSAHAILKGLPLLDPVQDDTRSLGSSELFAFKGVRSKSAQTTNVTPGSIDIWPRLPTDLAAASIAANRPDAEHTFPEAENEADDTNVNSILAVADNLGYVHLFLEGSYPLGAVSIRSKFFPKSLYKLRDHFFAHIGPAAAAAADPSVTLFPAVVQLPYLTGRHMRDVARVSSSARELLSYAMRVVRDMRVAWWGQDGSPGARTLGPKWLRSLEDRQKNEFGHEVAYALLDLTCLLTTGRSSESLLDYLGSGEHMSERSMQKWETIMTDALVRVRDLAEKRVAPACQRLYLLLQEVQGWAALPQYAVCNLKMAEVESCLDLTAAVIFNSSSLAAASRKELLRFKEFMKWIRYETARANATGDHHHHRPQHDILEVNEYLMSSLRASPIDKWFTGLAAPINRENIGVPSENLTIEAAIAKAQAALDSWDQTVHDDVAPRDLSHIERNLDKLLLTLTERCKAIFDEAARAAARSAVRVAEWGIAPTAAVPDTPQSAGGAAVIRERTVPDETKASDYEFSTCRRSLTERVVQPDNFIQFLAIRPPHDGVRSHLCVVRLQQGLGALKGVPTVEVAVLECCASGEASDGPVPFDLLDFDFFDSEVLVLVYRPKDQQTARIATVGYADLMYHAIPSHDYVTGTPRKALMEDVLRRLANGQVPSAPAPIIQSRTLDGCRAGGVTLAVNGRSGRRVSCVLDEAGLSLEVLDMEGDEEELELEEAEEDEGSG